MRIPRLIWVSLFVSLFAAATALATAPEGWTDDFDAAVEKAKDSGKHVLVDFTGSDWCGWCIRLTDEVFSKEAFNDYAEESLVLVKVDFPRRKEISEDVLKRNRELAQKFNVRGFPTIVLLDGEGKEVARTGYQPGGAEAYVNHLKGLLAGS